MRHSGHLRDRLRALTGAPLRTGRFFAAGEMQWALLSLLSESDSNGYQLMQRLEERCGGAYRPSAGTLYPCLSQLQDEGLISVESVAGKNRYSLTANGQHALDAQAELVADVWERASDWSEWGVFGHPDAAEIVGPALRVAKSALKAVVKSRGDPDVIDDVREILEDARSQIDRARRRRRR